MKIELSESDCFNIQASLVKTIKDPDLDVGAMKVLMMLHERFNTERKPEKVEKK